MISDGVSVVKSKLIVVYRTIYRLKSEMFISEQFSKVKGYHKQLWARDLTDDLSAEELLDTRRVVSGAGRLERLIFMLTGIPSSALESPALIHAHFAPDAAIILPYCKKNNIPLIVTCHGFDVLRSRWDLFKTLKPSNLLYLWRERKLFSSASRVIAVSEFIRQKLIARGCPAEKIVVHYIGIDPAKFYTSEARATATIIHVGRHVSWKGVDILLKALAIVKQHYPTIQLRQIGAGPETSRLQAMADELGIAGNITWLGALKHDDVKKELSKATLYVHPSKTDDAGQTEAFGIALLEAQASGLPVIASNSGGIPEAMQPGSTGFLVPENDEQAFAKQILHLLSSTETLPTMRLAAREFVTTHFDITTQTGQLERIYEEMINKSHL